MANRRFIDFPIAASVGNNDIVLIWQDGLNKQTTKATLLQGSPQSLAGLTDVDIAGLINGQILQYNSTTSKWENVDRTDINLSQLGDVTIVAPANGQVLVYNSSTGKWENSSAGFVPYTGAVTTVNLGAQSILAGSFVKAGGTSAQFLKANGSVDSTAYGTGTVTSVALTMPTAFSVANSPITTAGTLAVTATGTTAQYIRGDGSLATFPGLTGFVPYTGATADVNLGTHDLAAERGTFQNNGSSDTLTVNHTSGSGYGIIVTKGGANEALYVSKTSGSGNAMTVVGGRTSLVDLALSSVTNTAGDFLTLSGGVVHKRTAAQTLTDIGGQAALTNPVTGTGTTNYLPKFTGSTTIGNSQVFDNGTNVFINGSSGNGKLVIKQTSTNLFEGINSYASSNDSFIGIGHTGSLAVINSTYNSTGVYAPLAFNTSDTERMRITSGGNVLVGTGSDAGFKLDVNGTGRFNGTLRSTTGDIRSINTGSDTPVSGPFYLLGDTTGTNFFLNQLNASNGLDWFYYNGTFSSSLFRLTSTGAATFSGLITGQSSIYQSNAAGSIASNRWETYNAGATQMFFGFPASGSVAFNNGTDRFTITGGGNVLIGTTTDAAGVRLRVEGGVIRSISTYDNTTATAANLVISGGGTFERSTSSLKYKTDVRDYDKGLEVLKNMRPVYYKGKSKSDGNKQFAGLIAEEVHELGLTEFVQYANDGTPDALAYTHIIALLINSIKELKQEIDTLKN
jgi:hypothetical protein